MISLRELQNLLVKKGFNPYIDIGNPDKVLLHLAEEMGEIIKAYRKGESLEKELGDLIILACFFSSSVNIDLENATLEKIKENIKKEKFKINNYKTLEEYLGCLFETRK